MSGRRITRSRVKGWRMPPDAVYVGRGSRWGNPFHGMAGLYANWLAGWPSGIPILLSVLLPSDLPAPPTADEIRQALAEKDLACWCPPGRPCHADVLLVIANAPGDAPPTPANPESAPSPTWSCPVCSPVMVVDGPSGPECIRHGTQAEIEEDPDCAVYVRNPASKES